MSDSLQPHGLHQARPPCPSSTPRDCWNSCPLSSWCHNHLNLCHPLLLLIYFYFSLHTYTDIGVAALDIFCFYFYGISFYLSSLLVYVLSHSVVSDSLQSLELYVAHQAPLSMQILQARIWSGLPCSRGCSQPRDQTQVSQFADKFFTVSHQGSYVLSNTWSKSLMDSKILVFFFFCIRPSLSFDWRV